MNEQDPVKLWQCAIGAENHRLALLEAIEKQEQLESSRGLRFRRCLRRNVRRRLAA
jgi:hypothetical protein